MLLFMCYVGVYTSIYICFNQDHIGVNNYVFYKNNVTIAVL
jgi:hypothetical protein